MSKKNHFCSNTTNQQEKKNKYNRVLQIRKREENETIEG